MRATIQEQTGWRRPGEWHLCQDPEVLSKVTEFSYNVNDFCFAAYCLARGVISDLHAVTWLRKRPTPYPWDGKIEDAWELFLKRRGCGEVVETLSYSGLWEDGPYS